MIFSLDDTSISAIKCTAVQHISSDHMALPYWTCHGYGWMDAVKCRDARSWNVALVTCRVVSMYDGSYYLVTAGDDDGDERAYISLDDIGVLDSMHAAAIFQLRTKDVYGGSNEEYNDTSIPVITPRISFNLQCCSYIVFI
ncbi:predicted protein [Lichtheimia corymbifera JMRC:FSU:9682]|uniref:Uncharacterized protein n=1 Tax=Lichtheimia corymbifera JMRC:FSU:9682 TaxID=1263082 RepID=A0A068SEL0_9FUNG|nr:predicted protein [Lichtheimia corymbifera JMRC:FSU:9682]